MAATATKSLASQAGALQTGIALPSVFTGPQEKVLARSISSYIAFAHPKRADEWAKLQNKFGLSAVAEGDMFLVTNEEIHRLNPGKMTLLVAKQFWATVQPSGELIHVSFTEMPKPYREHIEAVVLVYLEDRIIPANITFRSTKCPAGKTLSDALEECQKPTWAEKSPQHKETLICAQPMARFFGNVTVNPNRTSRASGMSYRATACQISPTGVSEWRALDAFSKQEDAKKLLDLAASRYQERIAEVTNKAK